MSTPQRPSGGDQSSERTADQAAAEELAAAEQAEAEQAEAEKLAAAELAAAETTSGQAEADTASGQAKAVVPADVVDQLRQSRVRMDEVLNAVRGDDASIGEADVAVLSAESELARVTEEAQSDLTAARDLAHSARQRATSNRADVLAACDERDRVTAVLRSKYGG